MAGTGRRIFTAAQNASAAKVAKAFNVSVDLLREIVPDTGSCNVSCGQCERRLRFDLWLQEERQVRYSRATTWCGVSCGCAMPPSAIEAHWLLSRSCRDGGSRCVEVRTASGPAAGGSFARRARRPCGRLSFDGPPVSPCGGQLVARVVDN